MNRVTLIGYLGKDAEVRTTRSQKAFTVLSVATNRIWKDRETGDRRSETTWHRCIVWGRLGEYAASLTKGAHVQVEGDLRTHQYALEARTEVGAEAKRSITEIRVSSILNLDRPGKSGQVSSEAPA